MGWRLEREDEGYGTHGKVVRKPIDLVLVQFNENLITSLFLPDHIVSLYIHVTLIPNLY